MKKIFIIIYLLFSVFLLKAQSDTAFEGYKMRWYGWNTSDTCVGLLIINSISGDSTFIGADSVGEVVFRDKNNALLKLSDISQSYTFTRGLTELSETVKLGDAAFSENITLTSDVGSNRSIYLQIYDPDYYESSIFIDTSRILLYNGDNNDESFVEVNENNLAFKAQLNSQSTLLNLNEKGLYFGSDYSTRWDTDRYVPDLSWVKNTIHDSIAANPGEVGTVTSVGAGNGLDFSTITTTGNATLGTPSTLTSSTSNAVTATSHTHEITTGIANTNIIKADNASIADNDYAKFTATGLEGRSYSEVKTDLSLNLVENTALSTWAGTSNITTIGTVTSGTLSTGAVLADVTMSLGSDADADIYYRSSNKLARLAKGTALQQLRMNAGATAPEWFTPSSSSYWSEAGGLLSPSTSTNSVNVATGESYNINSTRILYSDNFLTNLYIGQSTPTISSGSYNFIGGSNAGASLGSSVSFNSIIGATSADASTTSSYNTIIGARSATVATSIGDYNVFIGERSAGNAATIGTRNIFIGCESGYTETGSNKLVIENSNAAATSALIYGEFDNDLVKINGTLINATGTITDNDATPDVSGANVWTYAGSANSVTITDLDNPEVGATYRIIGNSDTYTITINDGGNFNLSGNWTGGIDDVLIIYVQADNDYIEFGRSNN